MADPVPAELTTREAALYLGLSIRTFWRVAAPHMEPRRYSQRSIRWPRLQLDALKQAVTGRSLGMKEAHSRRRTRTPGMADLMAKHGCVG